MSMPALQASTYLHHLHFSSPDPERLADFYARVLDMEERPADGDTRFVIGPGRRLLIGPGPAKGLVVAGFAVRDADALAGVRAYAAEHDLAPEDFASPLYRDAFAVTDPDGNRIAIGLVTEQSPMPGHLHAPLQHLTLATTDLEAIEDFYVGRLGFAVSDKAVRSEDGLVTTVFMRGNHEHHTVGCFRHPERTGVDHHSYEAGEWVLLRDWADHFARHGVKLNWGPGRHGPGNNLFMFISDPDDNWIEISAELETIQDRPAKVWPHGPDTLNLWGEAIMRM